MLTALAVLAALAFPSAATAAPKGLARVSEEASFALAGDHVLFSRTNEQTLQVFAVPVTGGPERKVFEFTAPPEQVARARLDASAERVAVSVIVGSYGSSINAVQAFSGPPLGPWTAFTPLTALDTPGWVFPFAHEVDGARVFTFEARGGLDELGIVVRDPEPREVELPEPERLFATFAGDLVASANGRTLSLRDWRTGAVRSQATLPSEVEGLALRPDGHVAALTDDDGIVDVPPGGQVRRLKRGSGAIAFAGERLVVHVGTGLRVIEPAGRERRFGTPTQELGERFDTDDRHVAWVANRCLLVAPASTARAGTIAAGGPCPRSEVQVGDGDGNTHLSRRIPFTLECVAAPSRCQGSVQLRGYDLTTERGYTLSPRRRFSIPAGRSKRFRVRLTDAGYRRLRTQVKRDTDATAIVQVRTNDGDQAAAEGSGILILL